MKKVIVWIITISLIGMNIPVVKVFAADIMYHSNIEDAAAHLRKEMVERKTSISVGLTNDIAQNLNQEFIEELFQMAMIHTGNPEEGDYIKWQYDYNAVTMDYESNMNGVELIFSISYYSNAEQEEELDNLVKEVLNTLEVDSMKDNYSKIKCIYDYLRTNIEFDEEHQNDSDYTLQYTAYAALKNKVAACRGFSTLFYRLALELGIDSRIVMGTTRGQLHTWNIVQMDDGLYYNVDVTWDSHLNEPECFLLCDKNMPSHSRADEYASNDFHIEYPMGESDFIYEENVFTDVNEDDWYFDYIMYVYNRGLMVGTTATTFEPLAMLTRAMFAQILYNANDNPIISYEAVFDDVPEEEWYTQAVIWAYQNGIVSGYGNGKYGTYDNITREQLALMMYNYASKYKKYNTNDRDDLSQFTDMDKVSPWAEEAISWIVGTGIMSGKNVKGELMIDSQGQASRAECATIIMKFMELYKE